MHCIFYIHVFLVLCFCYVPCVHAVFRIPEIWTSSLHILLFILTLFAGTKKDLEEDRQVDFERAKNFGSHYDMVDVIETSSKENQCIDEAFEKMARVRLFVFFYFMVVCSVIKSTDNRSYADDVSYFHFCIKFI